jgi:hypothetical protein
MTFFEITSACQVLFGQETTVSPGFIAYLQPSGLKTAYRQLALQTHPDRAASTGQDHGLMATRFRLVHSAYETLKPYVMDRKPLPPFPRDSFPLPVPSAKRESQPAAPRSPPSRQTAPATAPAKSPEIFFHGKVPRTQLRIGQFLYYRRKISWRTLVRAMVWQQSNRPRLGDLAQEHGWLDLQDEQLIRQAKGTQELWGAAAVRCGILTDQQLWQLLNKQSLLRMPIGRYFVDNQILSESELVRLLVEQRRHNYMAQRT